MTTATAGEEMWQDLERRLQEDEPEHDGVWARLRETANVSSFQPMQAPGVVHRQMESQREGTYYVLNNPEAGTYLKLDGKDFYIWSLMDGTRSIKDLVVAYYSEYGSIAFGLIADLVAQLRAASFLTDPPIDVYAEVRRQCRRGTLAYWVEALWRSFLRREFAIGGIDTIVTYLYRRLFWVFFSKPALLIYPAIAVAGLGLFFYTVQVGTYPLFQTGGKWYLAILTFAVANVIVVMVREAAHAFATKHYGRKVRRGGLLIYFGSPALFLDTMDIWMEPKRSRIAASWAGPYSGLLLSSVCMLIIAGTGFADSTFNELVFKLAIWAFVFGFLANLNPLLEWDGYFILMDWLEIPMLRRRSMDFVRRSLLGKIVTRGSFSREEKIFAVFGILALVYTFLVIAMVLFFWQSRVSGVLDLIGGWVFWLLVGLITLVIGVPVALGIGVLAYKAAQRSRVWVYQRLFMGRPRNQVAALAFLALVVAVPSPFAGDIYMVAAGSVVVMGALLFSLRVAPFYLGSQLGWLFLALPWLMALLVAAQILGVFDGAAGSAAEVLAHGVVPAALLLALTYLFPTIVSFNRTILQGSWGLLLSGSSLIVIGAFVAAVDGGDGSKAYVQGLDFLGYGLLAASTWRLYRRLSSLRPEHPRDFVSGAISDADRLRAAMGFLVDGALDQFVQVHGRRALRALENQFNAASALGSGMGISISNGHISETGEGNLLERSQEYTAALSRLFSINSHMAGRRFVERELRGLYRLMPWEEREIGDEHLFRRLDLMSGVPRALSSARSRYAGLLRSTHLFKGLVEGDTQAISERLQPESYSKGKDIIRQGEPGSTFYIIESGKVEVWVRHEGGSETMEAELGRGDYFGERALLNDAPRAATCRSKSRVRLLSLNREDFDGLVARRFRLAEELDEAMERADLLRAMPVFSELATSEINMVASKLEVGQYPAGTVIIRQGEMGDRFYLVKSGIVQVLRRAEGTQEEAAVGRLGQGEYFGEIALLMDLPRTATVVAETDVELLSLDGGSFEEVVRDHLQSNRGLEQVSSRRLTQLRRVESLGLNPAQ